MKIKRTIHGEEIEIELTHEEMVSAAEALQVLKTATWIGTGVCGLVLCLWEFFCLLILRIKRKRRKWRAFRVS